MVDREKRLNVRVSEDELRMVNELAEAEGLSQSDVVRLYIRRMHAERFGTAKASKRPKR